MCVISLKSVEGAQNALEAHAYTHDGEGYRYKLQALKRLIPCDAPHPEHVALDEALRHRFENNFDRATPNGHHR